MNYKQIAVIALKILSLYTLIEALLYLSQISSFYLIPLFTGKELYKQENAINFFFYLIPFIVLLLLSIVIWKYAQTIAEYIILGENEDIVHYNTAIIQELQIIAFSVTGLVILVNTFPEIIKIITNLINLNNIGSEYATTKLKYETYYLIAEKIIKLALGFGLFFGGKGLSGLLRKIREFGS